MGGLVLFSFPLSFPPPVAESQPKPSLSLSKPCGSLPITSKFFSRTSSQFKLGGGDSIHTVGYEASQFPSLLPLLLSFPLLSDESSPSLSSSACVSNFCEMNFEPVVPSGLFHDKENSYVSASSVDDPSVR